jgi:hypothetical protein
VELNIRKEMKKTTIVLVLFFLNIGNSFCQESGKFLVFTFNCVYEIGEYKHGTGDNLWIIPYDSCLTNFSDRKLTPLFADDYLINSLSDSITNNQSFGYFPTTDYESNSNALKILKNRRTIQCRTTKFFFKNSKEQLDIYLTPIIAECRSHEFGFYKECVYTINGTLEIIQNSRLLKKQHTACRFWDLANFAANFFAYYFTTFLSRYGVSNK